MKSEKKKAHTKNSKKKTKKIQKIYDIGINTTQKNNLCMELYKYMYGLKKSKKLNKLARINQV